MQDHQIIALLQTRDERALSEIRSPVQSPTIHRMIRIMKT